MYNHQKEPLKLNEQVSNFQSLSQKKIPFTKMNEKKQIQFFENFLKNIFFFDKITYENVIVPLKSVH